MELIHQFTPHFFIVLNSLQAKLEDTLIPYTLIPIDDKCPDSSTSGMYNL